MKTLPHFSHPVRSARGRLVALVLCLPLAALAQSPAPPSSPAASGPVEQVSVKAVAHFGFDRVQIAADDRPGLLAEVGRMKDVSWQSVTATGHTDAVGDADYNRRLSERRAASVKRWLVGQGLPDDLVSTVAAGEDQPVADNTTADGRAANRRTEVEFRGVRPTSR